MNAKAVKEFIDAGKFIVDIKRTNRKKTATIKVEEGMVSVVSPIDTPLEKLEGIVQKKRKWILEKIAEQRAIQTPSERQFVSGESIPYLGRNYRLKVIQGSYEPPKLRNGKLEVVCLEGSKTPHIVRNAVIRWYKEQALRKLQEKTKRYAKIVGIEPKGVSIRDFKSRWGSCTSKGEIQYNWRIVMAPNAVCDYVVVHELCHLKRHDHSPEFWKMVGQVQPDYSALKWQLKYLDLKV